MIVVPFLILLHYKPIVIKLAWYCHKNPMEKRNMELKSKFSENKTQMANYVTNNQNAELWSHFQ